MWKNILVIIQTLKILLNHKLGLILLVDHWFPNCADITNLWLNKLTLTYFSFTILLGTLDFNNWNHIPMPYTMSKYLFRIKQWAVNTHSPLTNKYKSHIYFYFWSCTLLIVAQVTFYIFCIFVLVTLCHFKV